MRDSRFTSFLPAAGHKTAPWKNGGGVSREIAVEPPGSQDFLWRLSLAEISRESPFSPYPGFERLLTVFGEEKLTLLWEEGKQRQLKPGEVLRFSGEESILAQVQSNTIHDLGLIFHRQKVRAELHPLALGSRPRSFAFRSGTAFLVVDQGEVNVEVFPEGGAFALKPGDALRIDLPAGQNEALVSLEASLGCRLVAVEIHW